MDRRSFLSRLIVGAAAAPAVASVLAKVPPPPIIVPASYLPPLCDPGDSWLSTDGCWYGHDGHGWVKMTLSPRPLRYDFSTGLCVFTKA